MDVPIAGTAWLYEAASGRRFFEWWNRGHLLTREIL